MEVARRGMLAKLLPLPFVEASHFISSVIGTLLIVLARSLREYKDKFNPAWSPRYVAVPDSWSLPAALLDATILIGGGIRNTLGKG
jgi:lysylphosphatidylglycerol synthetase-like protein (DUF2156 family)